MLTLCLMTVRLAAYQLAEAAADGVSTSPQRESATYFLNWVADPRAQ